MKKQFILAALLGLSLVVLAAVRIAEPGFRDFLDSRGGRLNSIFGPLDTGDGTTTGRTASTYTAQLAVVIDAATGAFLYAKTL